MIVQGFEMQVASATIPTFMTWASIWPKPACKRALPGAFGDQDAGGPHHRIDDVADAQQELLHAARRRPPG